MSFSFEAHARSKPAALDLVRDAPVPELVRGFLQVAVHNLKPADENHPRVVFMKAHGHLSNGSDYDVSTCNLEVKSIPIAG